MKEAFYASHDVLPVHRGSHYVFVQPCCQRPDADLRSVALRQRCLYLGFGAEYDRLRYQKSLADRSRRRIRAAVGQSRHTQFCESVATAQQDQRRADFSRGTDRDDARCGELFQSQKHSRHAVDWRNYLRQRLEHGFGHQSHAAWDQCRGAGASIGSRHRD